MIIRESPKSKVPTSNANWPPKSPHEALLSSPSGLKKLERLRRHDTSPSPSKRRRYDEPDHGAESTDQEEDEDEDEDEETLQLKLQAIQAQLKLKRLQKAKSTAPTATSGTVATSGISQDLRSGRSNALRQAESQPLVQVPLSPKPRRAGTEAPESPRRVQLGIDKGLRASGVSLKRAKVGTSTFKKSIDNHSDLPRQKSKSFNEKLADARIQDRERQEKQERGRQTRSKGFGLAKLVGSFPEGNASGTAFAKLATTDIRSLTKANSVQGLPRSNTDAEVVLDHQIPHLRDSHSLLDPHSGFHLSKRLLDKTTLSESLTEKEILSIPQLLKTVTGPDYDPPDIEMDFVVLGIIASKSAPFNHASPHQISSTTDSDSSARSKFMVLRLTDLHWELDLFLFDTGFERFWKMTVGTVIAILNPAIMPPKPHLRDTGKFSLKLSSSEDTVLEVGVARDLGFCKSLKKDGKECGQWIDQRKTEFCDFHVNLAIEKTTSGRMEINGMTGMGLFGQGLAAGSGGKKGGHGGGGGKWRGGGGGHGNGRGRHEGLKREGEYYDPSLREMAYIVPPELIGGRSTAKLLDAEDYMQGALSAKERSRKRLAAHEKERQLAKQLSLAGSGLGGEYMRLKGVLDETPDGIEPGLQMVEPKDARTMGLVGSNAIGVSLSPVKGGRVRGRGLTAQPMGWGGAYKRLPSPTKRAWSVKVANNNAPAASNARFASDANAVGETRKEVRVVGSKAMPLDDDDDDDLDIV